MSNPVMDDLRRILSESILDLRELGKRKISITVKADNLLEAARILKEKMGFDVLTSAGAIDYIAKKIFQIVYYLWSSKRRTVLILRVNIPRENPTIQSLHRIWESADYHEREMWEMFGIDVQGHPNLTRILLPEDWSGGFPLRKDFDWRGGDAAFQH